MDRIEPIRGKCGKCGDFVYVVDGYDFEDGDPCHDCLQKAYDEQRVLIERLVKALENITFLSMRIAPPPYGHKCMWCEDCTKRAKDEARVVLAEAKREKE